MRSSPVPQGRTAGHSIPRNACRTEVPNTALLWGVEITEEQDRSTRCEGDRDTPAQGTPDITSHPVSVSFGVMEEHKLLAQARGGSEPD